MQRAPISVTIVTLNEQDNIARALSSVAWADDLIVVDSGSTDKTVEIAKELGARVFQREWSGYGQQKNYAQSLAKNEWVLNIDADEEVPAPLREEILEKVISAGSTVGYRIPRKTYYLGRWIMHGGWYPNYLTRLARKDSSQWTEPEVHEELECRGHVGVLRSPLHHFSFTGIQDQIHTNLRFSKLGFKTLKKAGRRPSILKLIIKPVGKFLETYVFKKGFMDGVAGLIISVNAAHSIFLKYAYFFEASDENPRHR